MAVAILTGAGSGIGRATALALGRAGYQVALAGRTRATLDAVACEITTAGGPQPLIVLADVSKFTDVAELVRQTAARWGRIDVLVNNAGVAPPLPMHQVTPEQWHEIVNTNLSAAFYATREAWPIMAAQKPQGGTIINISSMAAKDPFPGLGAYAVAKAGVNMLSLVTAREGESSHIRVIAIAPAGVNTAMFRNLVGEANVDESQILKPEDVAEAIMSAIQGPLRHASGDTIYLHRQPT